MHFSHGTGAGVVLCAQCLFSSGINRRLQSPGVLTVRLGPAMGSGKELWQKPVGITF